MIKTIIYALGILALSQTDLHAASTFRSSVLPLIDLIFIIFIILDLMLYFSAASVSSSSYGFFDLLRDIFDLRDDIREVGLGSAVLTLLFSMLDIILLFTALIYSLDLMLSITTSSG